MVQEMAECDSGKGRWGGRASEMAARDSSTNATTSKIL